MDHPDYATTIHQLEAQDRALREEMEDECRAFLESTIKFTSDSFRDIARKEVAAHPEAAKALGQEGLARLKSDLNELIETVPTLVERHVNADEYWVHRKDTLNDLDRYQNPYEFHGYAVPKELYSVVREAKGYLGALLIQHGVSGVGERERWQQVSSSDRPAFRYAYDWSEDMKPPLKRYADLYRQLIKTDEDLKATRRKKEEAEARDLWDQA